MDTNAETPTEDALRVDIEVEVAPDRAFQVFTQRFDEVKPRDHNLLPVDLVETVLEPWVGGRIYDRGTDGTLCQWGRVLDVEPPSRLVFSWDISPHWTIETDPARCSEVEVTFVPIDEGRRTRVELLHRHLARHGDGWQGKREAVGGDQGWPLYLARYADMIRAGD